MSETAPEWRALETVAARMTRPDSSGPAGLIPRRLVLTGTAALAAGAGLHGILMAARAPAFAQGARLHVARWSDFIPEADTEQRRQAIEAGKALGAEVHPTGRYVEFPRAEIQGTTADRFARQATNPQRANELGPAGLFSGQNPGMTAIT